MEDFLLTLCEEGYKNNILYKGRVKKTSLIVSRRLWMYSVIYTMWIKSMRILLHHLWVVETSQDGAEGPPVTLISHLTPIVALCCEVVEGIPRNLLKGRRTGTERKRVKEVEKE